jgi:hypothetical protein
MAILDPQSSDHLDRIAFAGGERNSAFEASLHFEALLRSRS